MNKRRLLSGTNDFFISHLYKPSQRKRRIGLLRKALREPLEETPERPERERPRVFRHPLRLAAHLRVFVGDVAFGQQFVQIAVRLQKKSSVPTMEKSRSAPGLSRSASARTENDRQRASFSA